MKKLLIFIAAALVASNTMAQLDTGALASAMNNSGRPAADKERDANRKAPEVLSFLGLEAGMTALDLIAIGGWYTEVLSYAVGDSGKVIMQNNPGRMVDNNMELINDRLSRRGNIEHHLGPVSDIAPGSVDFALTALNFHDVHNANPAAAQGFLGQIAASLKTGGILGVLDHVGNHGADNATLHRIAFEDAVTAIVNSGHFALVGSGDMLDNPADDHSVGPFDPSLGRNTDRFVLKFVKL